ncbi:MAG: trigger factor [Defluviitaleaceae bacterium]|nr:trigger factor [Defluviitaleaceae bacterium]
MSSTYETLENNQVKITLDITEKEFDEAINAVYNKQKLKINIQGFRKGKAPRKIIEMQYGENYFFFDAINHILPKVYSNALKEQNLTVVSDPQFDVEQVSKKGAKILATVYVKPTVELSKEDYLGLTYTKQKDIEVTQEEIDEVINQQRDLNTRLMPVERNIMYGDVATIDFEGFVDDLPFEGGKGADYKLPIGSGMFIDGFEDQLVNKSAGEKVEVNVTFPEDYAVENLKGKPAKFIVDIKEVFEKDSPELNDEFAQDVSEFNTLLEYETSIKEQITKRKTKETEIAVSNEILVNLTDKIKLDIPEVMIDAEVDLMFQNLENNIRQQGQTLESYMAMTGITPEIIKAEYRHDAGISVRAGIILDKISEIEGFTASEEEILEELKIIATSFGMSVEQYSQYVTPEMKQSLANDVKRQKANKMLIKNAIEVEPKEEIKETEESK